MNERTDLLIGENNRNKIDASLFIIAGLGGVGGTALEVITRFGASHFILLDGDKFEESNLNRQILSLKSNIGKLKTEVAKERILSINPNAEVRLYSKRIDGANVDDFTAFVLNAKNEMENRAKVPLRLILVDAIDDVRAKCLLYQKALRELNATVVASMGAGRAFYSPLEVKPLPETHTCPLAKAVRTEAKKHLTKDETEMITAVFATKGTEAKPQNGILPSSVTQTFHMGLGLAKTAIEKALD